MRGGVFFAFHMTLASQVRNGLQMQGQGPMCDCSKHACSMFNASYTAITRLTNLLVVIVSPYWFCKVFRDPTFQSYWPLFYTTKWIMVWCAMSQLQKASGTGGKAIKMDLSWKNGTTWAPVLQWSCLFYCCCKWSGNAVACLLYDHSQYRR